MEIAVPSKNRAGNTTTQDILQDSNFYVPESQVKQYKQAGIKNVLGVPKNVIGITNTRNWILKNSEETRLVFVDDDVKKCGYRKIFSEKTERIEKRQQGFWLQEFQKLFDLTEQLQYKIFGLRTEGSLKGCFPYKPILLRSYITASCMGIINDGEFYFDPEFSVKEDYELCLRHIEKKGGILAARYLSWENEHWETEGGCSDYRTINMERKAIKKLIRKYPGRVKEVTRKNSVFT